MSSVKPAVSRHVEANAHDAPRKRRRAQQGRALNTRAAIVQTAIREFSDFGFAGATTRRIAENAGVPNSLLHYHFPTKEILWQACADELFQGFGEELRRIRQHVEPGAPQVRAAFRAFLVAFVARPDMARFTQHDSPNLERRGYILETHLEGLFDWLSASVSNAQAEGLLPGGDPMLFLIFMLGGINNLATRKAEFEYFVRQPLDQRMVEVIEGLLDEMAFGRRSNARPAKSPRSKPRVA